MQYLRLYIILSASLAPAFAAAATDAENQGVIFALIAVLVGYAAMVLLGSAVIKRFRGPSRPVQA